MARLPRYGLPGVPQHVIQRGNNREPIFAHQNLSLPTKKTTTSILKN